MLLRLSRTAIRSWNPADAPELARQADNRRIWRNLRDRFPHPYTIADAEAFISGCLAQDPESVFAIVVDGRVAGAVGFEHRGDIWRHSVELGYWLGEEYWGRGIATEVARAMTEWAYQTWDINRIWAACFGSNPASARVLEKVGFYLESRQRMSAVKDGVYEDELIFATLRAP